MRDDRLRLDWLSGLLSMWLICSVTADVSLAQAPFAEESSSKIDLREAIFRYMFEHYNYGASVEAFCIQPEIPQPDRFLRRFSQNKPHVVWSSYCSTSGPMNGMRETKTGKRAVSMSIKNIRWNNGSAAEADVEAYSDGIAANWNILRIEREQGQWIVKHDQPNGVS
jgi:hypothetical protein